MGNRSAKEPAVASPPEQRNKGRLDFEMWRVRSPNNHRLSHAHTLYSVASASVLASTSCNCV